MIGMTRRDFGRAGSHRRLVVGGVFRCKWLRSGPQRSGSAPADRSGNRSIIGGVQFGLQPFCYHDLAMTPDNRGTLVKRLVQNGFGMVELHATWVEPRFTAPGAAAEAREKLRAWR